MRIVLLSCRLILVARLCCIAASQEEDSLSSNSLQQTNIAARSVVIREAFSLYVITRQSATFVAYVTVSLHSCETSCEHTWYRLFCLKWTRKRWLGTDLRFAWISVSRSFGQSFCRSVSPSVDQSLVGPSVGQLVGQSFCRSVGLSVDQSVSRSVVGRSFLRLFNIYIFQSS